MTSRNMLPGCAVRMSIQQDATNQQDKQSRAICDHHSPEAPAGGASLRTEETSVSNCYRTALAERNGKELANSKGMPHMLPTAQPHHVQGAESEAAEPPSMRQRMRKLDAAKGGSERQSDRAQEMTSCSTRWTPATEILEVAVGADITAMHLLCSTLRQDCNFHAVIGELSLSDESE